MEILYLPKSDFAGEHASHASGDPMMAHFSKEEHSPMHSYFPSAPYASPQHEQQQLDFRNLIRVADGSPDLDLDLLFLFPEMYGAVDFDRHSGPGEDDSTVEMAPDYDEGVLHGSILALPLPQHPDDNVAPHYLHQPFAAVDVAQNYSFLDERAPYVKRESDTLCLYGGVAPMAHEEITRSPFIKHEPSEEFVASPVIFQQQSTRHFSHTSLPPQGSFEHGSCLAPGHSVLGRCDSLEVPGPQGPPGPPGHQVMGSVPHNASVSSAPSIHSMPSVQLVSSVSSHGLDHLPAGGPPPGLSNHPPGVGNTAGAPGAPQGPPSAPPMGAQRNGPAGPPYPDMTTMVNANFNLVVPLVETQFVDYKVCRICNKRITRDMSRHYRIHQLQKRFMCEFPRATCGHKTGQFNRRYDFKKHLLNQHFAYDDPQVKQVHNLRDKLNHWGTCPCGQRFLALHWMDMHILTTDGSFKCPSLTPGARPYSTAVTL